MKSRDRNYAAAACAFVAVAVAAGFLMLGSPLQQRANEADRRRISDVQALERDIQAQYSSGQLPEALNFAGPRALDPETRVPYEYIRGRDSSYELCAVFQTDTRNSEDRFLPAQWRHPAGRHCWKFDARSLSH